jgi:hypothetical protein
MLMVPEDFLIETDFSGGKLGRTHLGVRYHP